MTKVQSGERTYLFILYNDANKTRNKETTVKLNRALEPLTKITTHKDRWEKELPKCGSKSETMIDSCP
jgi:hypothetical protein